MTYCSSLKSVISNPQAMVWEDLWLFHHRLWVVWRTVRLSADDRSFFTIFFFFFMKNKNTKEEQRAHADSVPSVHTHINVTMCTCRFGAVSAYAHVAMWAMAKIALDMRFLVASGSSVLRLDKKKVCMSDGIQLTEGNAPFRHSRCTTLRDCCSIVQTLLYDVPLKLHNGIFLHTCWF